MKLSASITLKLQDKEIKEALQKAARLAMRDTVVSVWNEPVHNTPKRTGHNMRSLAGEVSGMGTIARGEDAEPQKKVDDSKNEGAVYSTSGYGGYLETGTVKMAARPYMKPALDKEFTSEKFTGRMRDYLK